MSAGAVGLAKWWLCDCWVLEKPNAERQICGQEVGGILDPVQSQSDQIRSLKRLAHVV